MTMVQGLIVFTLVCGALALRDAGLWLWRRTRRARRFPADEIVTTVHHVCTALGLPADQLHPDFDLVRTGKLYEVLHHAAAHLGKDHELQTIGDVCDWLQEAPDRS